MDTEARIALAQAFGISSMSAAALEELIEKMSAVDMDEARAPLAKSGATSA